MIMYILCIKHVYEYNTLLLYYGLSSNLSKNERFYSAVHTNWLNNLRLTRSG